MTENTRPEDTHLQLAKSFYKKDLDRAYKLYAKNALFIAADGTAVSAEQDIKSELAIFAEVAASMKTIDRSIYITGASALVTLVWSADIDGEEKIFTATEIMQRESDGRWLYLIDNPYGC